MQYWLASDGQTDRQTQDDSIYRASIVSRDNNLIATSELLFSAIICRIWPDIWAKLGNEWIALVFDGRVCANIDRLVNCIFPCIATRSDYLRMTHISICQVVFIMKVLLEALQINKS